MIVSFAIIHLKNKSLCSFVVEFESIKLNRKGRKVCRKGA